MITSASVKVMRFQASSSLLLLFYVVADDDSDDGRRVSAATMDANASDQLTVVTDIRFCGTTMDIGGMLQRLHR
jgi:hypothetical protein